MTNLQNEIAQRSMAISRMGYMMAAGLVNISPENESLLQTGLVAMMEVNEQDKKLQNEAFEKMPWLKQMTRKETAKS